MIRQIRIIKDIQDILVAFLTDLQSTSPWSDWEIYADYPLADVLNRSRRANELVHQDSKNRDLDDLFEKASPYYCGVKMLGAGGAGYALFCSDSLSSAEKLREFLTKHFAHGSASVADFSLDMDGLSVEIL